MINGESTTSPARWLIIGLGNPGAEYEKTRHNIGAALVTSIAAGSGVKFTSHKSRANVAEFKLGYGLSAPTIVLATLRCYMNESGGPTKSLADFFKVSGAKIIVAHDELDIPFQSLRIKFGGGDNGHNGLKSISSALGSGDYFRIRLGIGRPPGNQDPADFVLKPFNASERAELPDFFSRASTAIETLISHGLERAQQDFNR